MENEMVRPLNVLLPNHIIDDLNASKTFKMSHSKVVSMLNTQKLVLNTFLIVVLASF